MRKECSNDGDLMVERIRIDEKNKTCFFKKIESEFINKDGRSNEPHTATYTPKESEPF